MTEKSKVKIGRREFVKAAAAGSLTILAPQVVRGTAANSAVRLGLLGCGRRGTTVATSMVNNNDARVVVLGDIFQDQLDKARKYFDDLARSKGYAGISQTFRGPGAYEQVAASKEIDAVVLATPDYFHPQHLEAVVAAGKHLYSEKPAGVDVPGAKRYIRAGEKAQGRLSLAVGFQIRKAPPFVELVRRIQSGALGQIACGQAYYFAGPIQLPPWPNASPAERRLRNWYHYREFTGDILIDQGIHVIDIINWALQSRPVKASGAGGRKVRQDDGNCWDHYNLTYSYPNDVHISFSSTQFDKGFWDVGQKFFGSRGVSEWHYTGAMKIYGEEPWDASPEAAAPQTGQFSTAGAFSDNLKDADPEKGKSFVQSIVTGNFLNEAAQGAESTLSTILGRMAAYTGRDVTWDEMLRSEEVLDPGIDLNQFG